MFDAVIFDLDGTLIDSESISQAAGREAFASLGVQVEPSFLHALIGIDDHTGANLIQARFPGLDPQALALAWTEGVARHHAQGLRLKPGCLEVLAAITLPKALATSSTRRQADRKLARTGLGIHFRHVVTFDDVRAPKPAPDAYLLAAHLLGADPARCLAFEDSETGARSAHAAGMMVVQVPDIVPASGKYAHHVAPDLMSAARRLGLI